MARAIAVEIVGDSASVERAFARSSGAAKNFDRSLSRSVRGAAAGSGAFRGLGRSLAFASASFLGVAAVTDVVRGAITGAEDLAKAQESLAVAVKHTGGNLGKLIPQYTAVAKSAAEFGVNQSDATTALARATVLTGSAARAQRAYQEALVISKATGKDFNAVLIATSKGQEGVTTSLKRYGIQIASGTKGTEQFSIVMGRFGGQAKANTDAADRLRAVLANTEETIGTALLPTLDKYLTELGDWLEKMQKSGRLQHDVNTVIHDGAAVFHVIGGAISGVDKVTGGFVKTLELLAAFKLASLAATWVGSLRALAVEWGVVGDAAATAGAAQLRAVGTGAAAGAEGAAAAGAGGRAALGGLSSVNIAAIVAVVATTILHSNTYKNLQDQAHSRLGHFGFLASNAENLGKGFANATRNASDALQSLLGWEKSTTAVITQGLRNLGHGGSLNPSFLPTFPGTSRSGRGATGGPFGSAQPQGVFKSFALTIPEQISQARAGLTKSTADDVAAAKEVIARIKKLMDEGRLKGKSLLQALEAEGSAISTLQSAQAAAAQKAAAAAQAQIQNMIDPLKVEVQLSKDQALGRSTLGDLRALKASAEKALASGKLSLADQKQAWDQITSVNQQIAAAAKQFTIPLKLQLALAREQALGLSDTATLEAMKRAILTFIHTGHHSIQVLIDAYNQLASINQQLSSTVTAGLGKFKQLNTRKLTQGLGLTVAQQKELRARLSQVGPKGTVPGTGTGAYGYAIGRNGRPIHVHTRIDIDGRKVAHNTTKHQQRRRRRNSSQRRGPNAGDDG